MRQKTQGSFASRGYFCFPEIDISIPHLPGMMAIVKKAMPYYEEEELVFSGKHATAKELEANRAIWKSCENQDVLIKEVMELARTFTKKRSIFRETKKMALQIYHRDYGKGGPRIH